MKVFVDVAAPAILVTQFLLIFLKCCILNVGSLEVVVQGGVSYLLVVHRRKKVGNQWLRLTSINLSTPGRQKGHPYSV